jgi:hypothetical protein
MTVTTRHDRPMQGPRLELRAVHLLLALIALGISACSAPPPAPTAAAATPQAATPSAVVVPLNVSFAGRIGCATFPYNCTATLSVLERNADIPDAWRPASSDPWWGADYSKGTTVETFDPKPLGGSPAAMPGPHRLVVSLLGSYDTPSYGPDGSRAFDLLGRCTADVEVPPVAGGLDVLVTFTPDEGSFRASCTVVAGKP